MLREMAAFLRGPPARKATAVCRADLPTAAALRHARQRAFAIRHALIELRVGWLHIRSMELRPGEALLGQTTGGVCVVLLQ